MSPADSIAGLSPEAKRKLLNELLSKKSEAASVLYPLSEGQKGLWVQHRLQPDSAAYISVFSVRILSELDVPALRRSFQKIIDRHDSLRSTFALRGGVPMQEVRKRMDVPFEETDASGLSEAEFDGLLKTESRRPFDLERGPVIRIKLFTRGTTDRVLLMTVYHIAFDHWSLNLILDELRVLYPAEKSGAAADLPPAGPDYTDFVRWQKEMLAGAEGERLSNYWQQRLSGELPVLNLPTDRPRPQSETFRGSSLQFCVDKELTAKLRALAKAEGKTLFSVVLGAFQVLLHRICGQEDILLGTPTLGLRRPEYQKVVGYFTNLVAIRADLSGDPTFREHLHRVQSGVFAAIEHQEYPFPLVVQRIAPKRDPSRSPVFQVQFNLIRVPTHDLGAEAHIGSETRRVELGGLVLEPVHLSQQEGQFDLDLMLVEESETVSGPIKFRSDLFDRETIERLAEHLRAVLDAAASNPQARLSELPLMGEAERRRILTDWNDTGSPVPETRVHRMFEAQARRTPDAVAASFGDRAMTYAELNGEANRLARRLLTLGVEPESLVGLCVERSLEMLVGLLGVLKAQAAYVPLDPNYPKDRLAFMLEDSRAGVLLTQTSLLDKLPRHGARTVLLDEPAADLASQSGEDLPDAGSGAGLAYTIFTSGSTGNPKGVQVTHEGVANILTFMRRELDVREGDSLLAVTTLSFDIAALELLLPIVSGARVVVADRETTLDGTRLLAALDRFKITIMQATPVTWRLLLGSGWKDSRGLKVLCGGEAWNQDLADRLLETGASVWNVYGPTETTIWSTIQKIEPGAPVVIGRPLANTDVYILDARLSPVPAGVAGDLYIGGMGLARGYLGRPDLTAEKFIPDPFKKEAGARIYKTGDVARWLRDGSIDFLGRGDHQVKIRGFRIEIGEIETALGRHPSVRQTVVVAREEEGGEKSLAAYVVPAGAAPTAAALREFLKQTLPAHMIPSAFVALERLPLTPNGKIDRKALPAPETAARPELDAVFADPANETERKIASVWQEVLAAGRIGMNDNFFELGGHSVKLLQVHNKLKGLFGIDIPIVDMFSHPTIGSLAGYLLKDKSKTALEQDRRSRQDLRAAATARLRARQERREGENQ